MGKALGFTNGRTVTEIAGIALHFITTVVRTYQRPPARPAGAQLGHAVTYLFRIRHGLSPFFLLYSNTRNLKDVEDFQEHLVQLYAKEERLNRKLTLRV